jgi:bifunctional DNA-binding transcriptional regulator/antitoxin component of YhaV-PrlF toxin-antitoxin module
MTNRSAVTRANVNTASLRATIPEEIVKGLKLQPGDTLDWSIVEDKGKKYAKFRKLE